MTVPRPESPVPGSMTAPGVTTAGSMSLLVDLVTNALEPEYGAAAERRDRHNAAAGRSGTAGTDAGNSDSNAAADAGKASRRGVRSPGLLALAGVVAAGALLGHAALEQHTNAPTVSRAHTKLVEQVRGGAATVEQLSRTSAQLRDDSDRLRAVALAGDDGDLASTLEAAERASASVAVTGPGIRIVLDDAAPLASDETDPAGRITDRDLQRLVNGLWSSGAEAVAVGGVRLTARSSIRTAGEAVLVDFHPVALPYVVEAIGDPAALQRTFTASAEDAQLHELVASYGIRYSVSGVNNVTLPAGSGLEPRLATALPPHPSENALKSPSKGTSP